MDYKNSIIKTILIYIYIINLVQREKKKVEEEDIIMTILCIIFLNIIIYDVYEMVIMN